MRLKSVRATPVVYNLRRNFQGSTYTVTHRNTIITRVTSEDGLVGQIYGGDEDVYQDQVVELINNHLGPHIVGKDPLRHEAIRADLMSTPVPLETRGLYSLDLAQQAVKMQAISAIDLALWDLIGKSLGVSISTLLGGYRQELPTMSIGGYYYQGDPRHEMLAKEIERLKKKEVYAIKMKVGRAKVDEDIRRLKVVREVGGDDFAIACDANQSWTLKDATEFALKSRAYNPIWLEEPLRWEDQYEGLALLRLRTNAKITAGQGEVSTFYVRDMLSRGCVDILNCDATLIGGVSGWREVSTLARQFNASLAHHEEPQVSVHLLTAVPHGLFVECFMDPARDPLWNGLIIDPPEIKDGKMRVPDGAGFGIRIKHSAISKYIKKTKLQEAAS